MEEVMRPLIMPHITIPIMLQLSLHMVTMSMFCGLSIVSMTINTK